MNAIVTDIQMPTSTNWKGDLIPARFATIQLSVDIWDPKQLAQVNELHKYYMADEVNVTITPVDEDQ